MYKAFFSLLILQLIAIVALSQHNVRFFIAELPANSSLDSSVYVAGSFNGWNPKDNKFHFQKDPNGGYVLEATVTDGAQEFKITRGSWDKVECTKTGADIQNRAMRIVSDTSIKLVVEEWADRFVRKPRKSTANNNVHIIDTAFLMPQLNRVRRVWIYLPSHYGLSGKHYPVLYMQDGQNVFDELTSFAGEWGVDETLDSIGNHSKEMIVVAVDHGGSKRINEYCPYDMEKYGKGEGDAYVDFLVKTLKPFIDRHYRTLKNKQHTFIAGSSMGGLISMYAVLKYPEVFGSVGVFSPAFWVGPKIFDDIRSKGSRVNSRIYFYCGGQESESMEPDMQRAFEEMRKLSASQMTCVVRTNGTHSEWVWKEEFPLFYLWIMEKTRMF